MVVFSSLPRELQNSGSVDFRVLLSRFFVFFQGVISTLRILPPEKKWKIGQNNPENRRTLSFATPSIECCGRRRRICSRWKSSILPYGKTISDGMCGNFGCLPTLATCRRKALHQGSWITDSHSFYAGADGSKITLGWRRVRRHVSGTGTGRGTGTNGRLCKRSINWGTEVKNLF